MKITAVETLVVNAIHRNWVFVKVLTDQPGLNGWGEATLEWKTRAVVGTVEDLAPLIVGEDPMRIEHVVARMTRFSFWPLGSIGMSAASGIEQALWDIKGKALGVPVWELLGGRVRDSVRVYTHLHRGRADASLDTRDISAFCDAVQETVEMGYNAIKLGLVPYTGYDARLPDIRHVEALAVAVRERVGDDVDIMTDFHGRPDSLAAARAYIDAIAPISPLFVEEPIQPGDTPAMAALAAQVSCPLATGERLFTPREFAEVAETRAVTYIQPDLAHCLGFSGGRRIAAIAEAAHIGVCPHNPMGPVAGAVALQFDTATPNFVIQEEAVGMVPWFEEICATHPLTLENGAWTVPEAPGLGIEIDEAAAARYPFAQEVIWALDAVLPDGRIASW
ncbi:galactonate dehydratase [Tropicimonas sp. IMCC6043]|uniref:galactonate dehydratase n=1 Tax=Tropicimonas sp. IMCC6043 TaxID=2510645 RepID=UPI00101C8592|nr:galactonate dehydratase [Tropicimonas sp. IMCC6043]RYH06497.1 galactonate dehydratase [Tropicimonas sp. IMCC6043]